MATTCKHILIFLPAYFVFSISFCYPVTAQKVISLKTKSIYNKLIWHDEFDNEGLPDSTKWGYDTGYIRNHELQYYTYRRAENARVQNGLLDITLRNDSLSSHGHVYPITSAALITRNTKSFTYGRLEVRARIPSFLGSWPAIWMLGSNDETEGWPLCGEIDIMEHVGYMPDTLHFNVHTKKYNHVIHTNKGSKIYYSFPDTAFHVYALEWTPADITWFFDGKAVFNFKNEGSGTEAWPFSKPFFVILNLAFGGDWGGSKGVATSALPRHYYIDYVRLFQ